jgi:hypothetical protein
MEHSPSIDNVNIPQQHSCHNEQADQHDRTSFSCFKTTYQDIESSHLATGRVSHHDPNGRLELHNNRDSNVTDDDQRHVDANITPATGRRATNFDDGAKRSFRWISVAIVSICLIGSLLYPMEDKIRRRAQPRSSLDYGVYRFRKVMQRYLGNNAGNNYYNGNNQNDDNNGNQQNVNDDVANADDLYLNAGYYNNQTNGTYYEEPYYAPKEGEYFESFSIHIQCFDL